MAPAAAAGGEAPPERRKKVSAADTATPKGTRVKVTKPKKPSTAWPSVPSWGASASFGDGDEELNPGMLLAELVGADDSMDRQAAGHKLSRLASKKGKPRRGAKGADKAALAAAAEAEELEDEHLASSGDENEAAAGESGDRLLEAVGSLPTGGGTDGAQDFDERYALAAKRRALQARPESEFHAGGVGEEVTVEDLLAPIAEAPSFGDVRKQLEGLACTEKLPEPVSEPARNREERAAQYENTKKDQGKWIPQIQQMRKADQIVLGEVEDHNAVSTASIVGTFKPMDDFEKELEALTKASGATEEDVKGAKVLPVNPRIRDEKQIQQVAKLKALMLREQKTSRRVNKIKSKTYRRIHRKAEGREREALLERLETENPELASALKQEYEKKRAQMRLMRQRNARTKWTKTMQRFAKGDKSAQLEISKQAQAAHDERMSLRRAIAGKDPNQDEDSDAVDFSGSDSDGEGGRKRRGIASETIRKAKKLTVNELKDLENGGELPTTGILGMGFMREAIRKKRDAAKLEAQSVLQELEGLDKQLAGSDDEGSDSDGGRPAGAAPGGGPAASSAKGKGGLSPVGKKREFTAEELAAARDQVDALLEKDGDGLECSVSGPLSVKGVASAAIPGQSQGGGSSGSRPARKGKMEREADKAASAAAAAAKSAATTKTLGKLSAAAEATAAENPWLDVPAEETPAATTGSVSAAPVAKAAAATASSKAGKKRKKKGASGVPAATAGDGGGKGSEKDDGDDDNMAGSAEDVLSALNADSAEAREQRDLVRTAFVEGTQLEDFDDEQEEKAKKKEEDAAAASKGLVGWGSWTGTGIRERKPKGKGKGKGKEAKGDGKGGFKRPMRIEVNEGRTENPKYFIDQLPYGKSPDQYEQAMRMPTGPEWNALPTHMDKIKPKYFMKVGAIVAPLQYVKHLPPDQRESAIKTWAASKQPKRLKSKI